MPKKKITVVDIKDDETADIVDSNEPPLLEPIIEENNIETQETPVEENPIVEDKPVEDKPIVEDKIVRTNELIKCPKCLKMVTNKTLKYSHKKTCTGEQEVNKPKPILKKTTVIPDIEEVPQCPMASVEALQPKLVRTISKATPVTQQPTPEMMKTYRNQMRTEQLKIRSDRMSSLFTNSI